MKGKIADINELRNQSRVPDGDYVLESMNIKEIVDKYPDKIIDVVDRKKDVVIIMDTCRIVFKKVRSK